ncbi:36413_t:CDS:1, partial [Gigaspora margarita]
MTDQSITEQHTSTTDLGTNTSVLLQEDSEFELESEEESED